MNGIFFITKLITIDIDILLLDYHRVTAIPWLKKSPYKLKKSYVLFRFSLQTRCCGRANRLETETFFFATAIAKNGERNGERVFFFLLWRGRTRRDRRRWAERRRHSGPRRTAPRPAARPARRPPGRPPSPTRSTIRTVRHRFRREPTGAELSPALGGPPSGGGGGPPGVHGRETPF